MFIADEFLNPTAKEKDPAEGKLPFLQPSSRNPLLSSATRDVANRALPLAQFRIPVICSAVDLDNRHKIREIATSKSAGFPVAVKRQEQGIGEHAFDLAPRQPIRRSGQLREVKVGRIAAIFADLNAPEWPPFHAGWAGPRISGRIRPNLPCAHFGRQLGNVVGCGHHKQGLAFFLRETSKHRAEVPPSVDPELLLPAKPFSNSSSARQQGQSLLRFSDSRLDSL